MGESKPNKQAPPTVEERIQITEARSRFRMMEIALKGTFNTAMVAIACVALLTALVIIIDAVNGHSKSPLQMLQDFKDMLMTGVDIFKIAIQ